ncbi:MULTISPECIES: DUF2059 domain-containing protein [unclassified Rhizobium]|uniref:DUF2059 domain-containing protein n=1 Tax=unclassified Rhizobium TaxID=2613769 RepID=UPI001601F561|nr:MULTISPECIES: DUF2059 domain-containing protein [unclassified Rhizobium]MBB1247370.1 DUF2059 domain-containing protein [Rhizobium sp. G21]MCV3764315.1 DUF2059 domain-containing protein [Rhizobium sp. TRM95796]
MMKIDRIGRAALVAGMMFGFGASLAVAQESISDAHLKAARSAMKAIKITEPFDAILPNIAQRLKGTLIQSSPNYEQLINDTVDAKALELAARRADLEKEAAAIYAKTFSEEELNQIAAFYSGPAGQKLLKDGPLVIRQLSKAADIWATGMSRDLSTTTDAALETAIAAEKKAEQPKQ